MPAQSAAGRIEVRVSLNNATNNTLTPPLNYSVYAPPVMSAVSPLTGPALGGTLMSIFGSGFAAVPVGADGSTSMLVRFGAESVPISPIYFNDTVIVCNTSWGSSSSGAGEIVSVALNGASFVGDPNVRFAFTGLHPPALVDVYFTDSTAELVMQFDSQPTNRAGQNGMEPCSQVLAAQTVALLRGTGTAEPLCDWRDDTTYVAYLTYQTQATAGMAIHTLPGVLWPKAFTPPAGGCASALRTRPSPWSLSSRATSVSRQHGRTAPKWW